MRKRIVLFTFVLFTIIPGNLYSQSNYGYGSVIGGQKTKVSAGNARSLLDDNEEGVRVILIQTRGGGLAGLGRIGGGGAMAGGAMGGGVQIMDVPKDTDYLELLVFYANIDPRGIRKDKFKILRVASTGKAPYLSKDLQRYWTTYNFKKEYERGGPFELVRPYDIIIIEPRGILNREFFDPITDITFLLTLPTIVFSFISVYNTFFK